MAITYSRVSTTIGLGVFHFWVRNGIRWDNSRIIVTGKFNWLWAYNLVIFVSRQKLLNYMPILFRLAYITRSIKSVPIKLTLSTHKELKKMLINILKLWVYRRIKWLISTSRLNPLLDLHLRPINPVICGESTNSHLGVSFALICFQRLSIPDLATRQCPWQDNRYTRGQFVPVLSY